MKLVLLSFIVLCITFECQAARGDLQDIEKSGESQYVLRTDSRDRGNQISNENNNFRSRKYLVRASNVLDFILERLERFKNYCDEKGWKFLSSYTSRWIQMLNDYLGKTKKEDIE